MEKKATHISLRLKESQVRWLREVLAEEQRTKSQIIRDAINKYLVESTHRNEVRENKKNHSTKGG